MALDTRLQIQRAEKTDMDIIADFIRSSAEWYKPFLAEKDLKEHYVDEKWKEENFKKRDFYLGRDANQGEVGTISLQYFGNYAYLGYIYLDSRHVGKGYGPELINFAKRKCLSKGLDGMCLIAHPEAQWAIKAYEKYGFEKKCTNKNDVLSWNNGFLKNYYEEGFHLYVYEFAKTQ